MKGLATFIETELERARKIHPGAFASAHEGWAVMREELDELWDHVKQKDRDHAAMRLECIQIAAMAIRFIEDICDTENTR